MSGQLVEQWPEKKIEDVLHPIIDFRGRTPKKLGLEWGGGDIHALSALNVKDDGIDFTRTKNFGSEELYSKWMTKGEAAIGDVILTTEAPLGKVAQIPDSRKYILSQRVVLLKPKEEILNADFLAWVLRSPDFQKKLQRNETGATVRGIRMALFKNLTIPIPPLKVQKHIAKILDEAFENISNSSKRVEQKLLDSNELSQSITHCVITPKDHNYDEYALEELTHKITKGSSPKWQGVSYIDEPGVLFVTSENVGRNQMIYKKTKFVEDKFNEIDSKSILRKGDVLTNIVGASIGRTAVFDKDDNSNINQAVCLIRCNEEKLINKYLAYLLNSHFFVQRLHDNEVNTARANLSLGFFRSLIIPVPTISEQYEIIEKLDLIYSNISEVKLTLERESRSLDELKQSILQEAFNGNLRIA